MIPVSKLSNRRDQTGFGGIDYALMGVGSCLAVFAAGKAIGAPESGQLFVFLIAIGTTLSRLIRKFFPFGRFLVADSVLYAAASIAAVFFSSNLNGLLPAEGIPPDVTTAGWLCWMLTFGSFLVWRDRTLLFQAVPTIALFGLIGCYDTYAPAPFLFFGFLLCLATLLGRSHSREMLRLAVLSGYFNRGESRMTVSEQPEQSPELYELIKKGPWRWLAGPEWALLSGLVIVVFSLLGAPVIRQAVQPISGAIRVLSPRRLRQAPTSRPSDPGGWYQVGRGPLTNQSMPPVPLLVVKFDRMRYLRTEVREAYTGQGWSPLTSYDTLENPGGLETSALGSGAVDRMKKLHKYQITVDLLTPSNLVPLPGETYASSPKLQFRHDGAGMALSFERSVQIFAEESDAHPNSSKGGLSTYARKLTTDVVPAAVKDFAVSAGKGSSDFEKAKAIQAAIAKRCVYYLGASAVPEGRDAADYFLNTSRQGYCDLFATAMVECARAIDIPAHFVLGYLPDPKNTDKEGKTIIFDKDYHAWAELYFKDVGWVIFDATEGASELNPDSHNGESWFGDHLQIFLNISIGILGLSLCLALGYGALKTKTRQPGLQRRSEVEKVYARFGSRLRRFTGERRELGETADEYLTRIGPLLGASLETATRLNQQLVFALYGTLGLDPLELASLKDHLRGFENILKNEPKNGGK